MALALEVRRGNAKAYVYDDMCKDNTPEEAERRDLRLREVMGRILSSHGAAERYAAYIEHEKTEPKVPVITKWHPPYGEDNEWHKLYTR